MSQLSHAQFPLAGIPISSSIIDEAGVPQLLNRGEQTVEAVTGSGGRLHFGMVAGHQIGTAADIKSESPAGLHRNSQLVAALIPIVAFPVLRLINR